MSNYFIKTQYKESNNDELVEDIKTHLENCYTRASAVDRIGFYVPVTWSKFIEILKQTTIGTVEINNKWEPIHQIKTFNGGIINVICDNELSPDDRRICLFMQGIRLTQAVHIGIEYLSLNLVANINARVGVKL